MYTFGHFPVLKLNKVVGPKTEKSTGAKNFYFFIPIKITWIELTINGLIGFFVELFFIEYLELGYTRYST